jgi:hypothetical protein
MRNLSALVLLAVTLFALACNKTTYTAGKGGTSTLTLRPYISDRLNNILMSDTLYNNDTASKSLIGIAYIRYGATDTNVIDISHSADDSMYINGTNFNYIQFYSLQPAYYYVYIKGTINKQNVQGGNSYFATQSKEVPVYLYPY